MSRHIHEWLGSYLDGELRGSRLQYVEAHFAECPTCRAELDSLKQISFALQEAPAPEFTPPERVAAQVILRLPPRQETVSGTRMLEIGWWMIPVGLLAAWIFFSTSFFISGLLSAAHTLGLSSHGADWTVFSSAVSTSWSAMLGQSGMLNGNSLDLAAAMEASTRSSLPQISLQVSIALLYLGWIAVWWARQTRQGLGWRLEG